LSVPIFKLGQNFTGFYILFSIFFSKIFYFLKNFLLFPRQFPANICLIIPALFSDLHKFFVKILRQGLKMTAKCKVTCSICLAQQKKNNEILNTFSFCFSNWKMKNHEKIFRTHVNNLYACTSLFITVKVSRREDPMLTNLFYCQFVNVLISEYDDLKIITLKYSTHALIDTTWWEKIVLISENFDFFKNISTFSKIFDFFKDFRFFQYFFRFFQKFSIFSKIFDFLTIFYFFQKFEIFSNIFYLSKIFYFVKNFLFFQKFSFFCVNDLYACTSLFITVKVSLH